MTDQPYNRLHQHMSNTVAVEAEIEETLTQMLERVSKHPQVKTVVEEFHKTVKSQRETLETRLSSISSDLPDSSNTTPAFSEFNQISKYPVSSALQHIYTMFSHAIMSYTTLQPITLRFRDSWVASEDNTAIIVKRHTTQYAAAMQQISQLIHDVVVWEMDQEGLECQCTCPSCSLGICLCPIAGRTFLDHAWSEAGPIFADKGITVSTPKLASAAANAGLHAGDIIIAVDGNEVNSINEMISAVKPHKPGETIELYVQQASGGMVNIAVEVP